MRTNLSSLISFTLGALLVVSLQTPAYAGCESFGDTSSDLFDKIEEGHYVLTSEKFLTDGVEFTEREKALVYKMVAKNQDDDLASVSNWDYIVANYHFPSTYDELHIKTFREMGSNETYDYVWSYPGDNEYGVIFNSKGEMVAEVGDGDLYCY